MDNKLDMSQQRTAPATRVSLILGCIHRDIISRDRDVINLLYPALVRLHLEYCVQFWSPQFGKDADRLERVQRRATKMTKGMENLPCEETLKTRGLFCLQKKRLRRELLTVFQYLKGNYKEDGGSLFTRSHMEKTRVQVAPGDISSQHKKKIFYSKNNHSLEQRGCGRVHITGGFQDAIGQGAR